MVVNEVHCVHVFHVTIHSDAIVCDLLFDIAMELVEFAPLRVKDLIPLLTTAWLQNSKNKHEGAPQIDWSLDMLRLC